MKKMVYVILHYGDPNITFLCIESVLRRSCGDSVIVVNNDKSNAGSECIRKKYGKTGVTVIDTGKNLGFAKGLNVGIKYAFNKMNPEYIFLLNNDTEIITENLEKKVDDIHSKTRFDVLGPDIVSLDNIHCNPRKEREYSVHSVRTMIMKTKIELFFLRFFGLDITKFGKHTVIKKIAGVAKKNVEVHGSAFILSNSFIRKEKGLYDKTFLYGEESILKYICDRDGLITYYDPDIKVLHKEEFATKNQIKNERSKRVFQLSNVLASRKEFLKLIKEDREVIING